MGEFDLIDRFFRQKALGSGTPDTGTIVLGIGDDCALLQPAAGQQLAVTSDMLVEGRHFLPDVDPAALGHKALAVNLSDLAAMGAEPLGFTLALALPPERAADIGWLDAFSNGLLQLAKKHACALVGGDTTAGPLNLCITAFGQVPAGQALRRDGARAGDNIWVSGRPGAARLALGALRGEWSLPPAALAHARQQLERPEPRLALGQALRGIASSCIDVSDGLLGDLGHILKASGVGASIKHPLVQALIADQGGTTSPADEAARHMACILAGGDDYELVFTAPPTARAAVLRAGAHSSTRVTCIGHVEDRQFGLRVLDGDGRALDTSIWRSFDHFAK